MRTTMVVKDRPDHHLQSVPGAPAASSELLLAIGDSLAPIFLGFAIFVDLHG
jgi:hypothetical protein